MSAPIFISYSSKDQDVAEMICQALEARGHACWIASRNVKAGQNFQEMIVRALRSAKVMLLVFTANANNSEEVKKELVLAGRHRVAVVPIRAEDVVPNDAFAYELATRQWIDLFRDWEQEIEVLVERIGQIVQDGGDAEAAPRALARQRIGAGRQSRLLVGLAFLAAFLVIGAAVVYLRPAVRAPSPAAQQTAAAPPPAAAPSPPPQAPTPAPAPPPPASAQIAAAPPAAEPPSSLPDHPAAAEAPPGSAPRPDEAAWQTANAANTVAAFEDYLKASPDGAHAEEAQLQIADLILSSSVKSKAHDGRWLTKLSCPTAGRAQAYFMELVGEVSDGAYRARVGGVGEPGSLVIDGRITADGDAAFLVKGLVGSAATSGGLAVGMPYFYHALGKFEHAIGSGNRIEFRRCTFNFAKQ